MITFDAPLTFDEAMDKLASLKVLPTDLSSAQIRRQWSAALRDRSLFSARTTKAEILKQYQAELEKLLEGKTNIASSRARLQELYDQLGYRPEEGFPGEEGLIPGAERGSLTDLSSNPRIDMVLVTNMRQVANWGFREKGQAPDALWAYPCYELLRIYPRLVPRGFKMTKKGGMEEVPGDDWPSRWEACGGEFFDGRMIARKDDDIWAALGDSSTFDDAMDTDIPPFAYNSGYGWCEVARDVCIELGVIGEDDEVDAQALDMNQGLSIEADKFDAGFLKALRQDLLTEITGGRLGLAGNALDGELLQWILEDELTRSLGWNTDYHQRSVDGWVTRRAHMMFMDPDKGDGRGAGGSSAGVHPLDKTGPIPTETAARLMEEHPDHPTTVAFRTWFTHPSQVTEEQGAAIHRMLDRLPVYRVDQDTPIFKGISCKTLAERDALVAQFHEEGKVPFEETVNSASKLRGIANDFSQTRGPGIVLTIQSAKDSVRDVGPLVKRLAPQYEHQQELIVIKDSQFSAKLTQQRLFLRYGRTPVFNLKEL